ncbi:GTP-binding protein Rho1 [Serendipita sp. 401]|nr:GTP-binding protein Rho1 [Serendipita sp. 401]
MQSFHGTNQVSTTTIDVTVIGDSRTGKTHLLMRLLGLYNELEYVPNRLEGYKFNLEMLGKSIQLCLCDSPVYRLAGGRIVPPRSYLSDTLTLVCFAIDDMGSLEHVERMWSPRCPGEERRGRLLLPILLIGCKMDVREDHKALERSTRYQCGTVSTEQGKVVAKRIGASMYLECSAKTGKGVHEVFYHGARLYLFSKRATK